MKKLLFLLMMLSFTKMMGQSITPSIINTSGGTSGLGPYNIDWAIGNIFIANNPASGIIITPGSVQPFKKTLGGINNPQNNNIIKVYPNPTQNIINIYTAKGSIFSYKLYNVQGEKMKTVRLLQTNACTYSIDITTYPMGNYILNFIVKDKDEKSMFSYKIQKLQ